MQSAQFAVGVELFPPSGQHLVCIGLMPHVPHDAVVGRVEDIVQGDGQFHHAERRGKMPGILAQLLYEAVPKFVTDSWQLLYGQFSEVGW